MKMMMLMDSWFRKNRKNNGQNVFKQRKFEEKK